MEEFANRKFAHNFERTKGICQVIMWYLSRASWAYGALKFRSEIIQNYFGIEPLVELGSFNKQGNPYST